MPESLRPAFDAVCDAFALYESGQDDAAREKLQSVGLSSPFLDWKLLLRGLIAYAAGDDARALDNWSRLAADRLAGRLIAPLRFALDPAFRAAQRAGRPDDAAAQATGSSAAWRPALRALQALLARRRLADAFRQAEIVLPELKRELAPAVGTARRVFPGRDHRQRRAGRHRSLPARSLAPPADDPTLARLEALAAEEQHAWPPPTSSGNSSSNR